MSMKQGEAVFQAVVNVTGKQDGAYVLTTEQRAEVREILFEGFKQGKIVLSKGYTDKELDAYIPGLISNWLRKDPRLNGGVKYTPKNPGSRAGQGDETVRNMKLLLDTVKDPAGRAHIQAKIDERVAALKPPKKELTEEQKQKLIEMGLGDYIPQE
jgi:hypothetical protein